MSAGNAGPPEPLQPQSELWSAQLSVGSRLQPWVDRATRLLPLILLGFATLIVLLQPHDDSPPLGETLGIVAGAAVWVLATDTCLPRRWKGSRFIRVVGFAGTLALAAILMSRDITFLAFMIGSFFTALELRPWIWMWSGLAATSMLINSIGGGGPIQALREWPYPFVLIVILQTLAIGSGTLMAERLVAISEQQRRTVAELESTLAENTGLHRQLLSQAREAGALDERQRLSLEIHDTLAQGFTGIITQLEAADQARIDQQPWQRHVDQATALARENLAEARRSVRALSPEPLATADLPEALSGIVDRWSVANGVRASFTTTGVSRRMHPEIEATLVRVTQEALTNVGKHADAGRVGLTLSYMEDQVTLDVRDDGVGFAPDLLSSGEKRTAGFGLVGMRHRVHRLAGQLEIESEPGSGTAVSASVPAVVSGERA